MTYLFEPLRAVHWRWSLAFVNSLTLVGVATITACNSRKIMWNGLLAAALALLTPPLWYHLWAGQIDGLVLIGLVTLPWSIPLLLLRPQIVGWVLATRRRWTVGMAVWIAVSLLMWGWWPERTISQSTESVSHPTAMGWATLGWPILLPGLWMLANSRGDPLRALAAAMWASPYVQPYHMVLLLPALGRVSGWKLWVLWGWVWVVGIVPAFRGVTRYLALGFPLAVWWFLQDDTHDSFWS
jgi:hypothetical protein